MLDAETILTAVEVSLNAKIKGFKQGLTMLKEGNYSDISQTVDKVEFAIEELQEVLDSIEQLKKGEYKEFLYERGC